MLRRDSRTGLQPPAVCETLSQPPPISPPPTPCQRAQHVGRGAGGRSSLPYSHWAPAAGPQCYVCFVVVEIVIGSRPLPQGMQHVYLVG